MDDFAPTVQTGVASLNPEALRKDEDGRKRLYACYDPYIENESERPLKSFDCDPAFRGLIEPPPEKARKALEAAERVLEEAKKAAARAKTQEAIAAREEKLSSLREAVRAAEVDAEVKEAANASGLSRRIRRRPMPGGREEGYTEAEMPIYSAEVLLERAIEEAKKPEDDLCEARAHVREAEAALREADASLIISVAFTRVMGRGEMTYVWLCGVEGCPDASFTTEAWLKTKFSEGWLKVCKAAPYVGRFRLVTKRAWHIPPPKQTASIVPRPPVASKTPVLPTLDAVLQGALSQVDLWRRAAVQEFEEGWAPSPSDAYAIGFSKRDQHVVGATRDPW